MKRGTEAVTRNPTEDSAEHSWIRTGKPNSPLIVVNIHKPTWVNRLGPKGHGEMTALLYRAVDAGRFLGFDPDASL